jgi:LmbE family N-acetylglucosaminyl deacetylase
MSPRTLLGVWAHPDDEAYLSAGLMHTFRRRGDRVVIVTTTLGEHGTTDPESWPPHRLAARRHTELRNSLAALDVDELRLLGYEDGYCADHDATDVVAAHIADIEPDLIVTFGPDGLTGHPDHQAVGRWTTTARALAWPAAALWYVTVTAEFHERWDDVNELAGLWAYDPRPPVPDPMLSTLMTRLDDAALDRKFEALAAHTSQTAHLIECLGVETYREWWRYETFRPVRDRAVQALPSAA